MATQKQIDANRRNAQLSTGPRTPEGKAAVCMNALRHGFRARTVVLPGENRDEFFQLCDDLEAEWQPQTRTEQFMLELMAVSQWKLARLELGEHSVYERDCPGRHRLPDLDTVSKLQVRLERTYFHALRELQRLQHSGAIAERTPAPPAPPVQPQPDPQPAPRLTIILPAEPAASAKPTAEPLDSVDPQLPPKPNGT